jgi:hypothetical protein
MLIYANLHKLFKGLNKKAKSIKPNRRRLLNENEQKLLLGIDDDDD